MLDILQQVHDRLAYVDYLGPGLRTRQAQGRVVKRQRPRLSSGPLRLFRVNKVLNE
jgi:hypothetical protein